MDSMVVLDDCCLLDIQHVAGRWADRWGWSVNSVLGWSR